MSPLFRRTTRCPYCGEELDPKPTHNQACPHCGQQIFVREGKLLTEEEIAIRDRLDFLGEWGVTLREFDKHRAKLTEELGRQATVNEAAWGLLHQLAKDLRHHCGQRVVFAEMAHLARVEGQDPNPHVAEALRAELRALKKDGFYRTVQVLVHDDDATCATCRELADKIFPLDEALAQMPIPAICQSKHGCRCTYLPV